jgi:hypothetical protein
VSKRIAMAEALRATYERAVTHPGHAPNVSSPRRRRIAQALSSIRVADNRRSQRDGFARSIDADAARPTQARADPARIERP